MTPDAGRLSVVIPAYNEAGVISQTLAATLETLAGLNFEIVVVDDGSRDDTQALIQQAAEANARIISVHFESNHGKGHALRQGFARSTGDRVAFLDADLDLHPRLLRPFLTIMDDTQADIVIGSKLHAQSQLDYPVWRRILSRGYYFIIRLLFKLPVQDTQTGIKLFRRPVLEDVLPRVTIEGFAFDLQLLVLAHQRGYRLCSAPVVLTWQRGRLGRIGWRVVWQIWRDTWRVFWRTR